MNANDRIQWLHKHIAAKNYPNATLLAERFGVSHRQAQRDLQHLRETLGAPLAYDARRRGFYYKKPYSLPAYTSAASGADYVEAVTLTDKHVEHEILQMQIPYSARLLIPNKLTQVELGRFLTERVHKNEFLCEFHNVEVFLGAIFAAKTEITVLDPDWLRERLIAAAERILKSNKDI